MNIPREKLEQWRDALQEVQDLIGETAGVYGLHLNGDASPWDELVAGGRFERLTSLDAALSSIEAELEQPQQPVHLMVGGSEGSYDADALHAAIMNLPCKPENMDAEPNQRLAYKVGHRDARHAAAELVAAAQSTAPESPQAAAQSSALEPVIGPPPYGEYAQKTQDAMALLGEALELLDAWPGTGDFHGLPRWVGRANEFHQQLRDAIEGKKEQR